ncbi:hypothetical protein IL306_003483 [Fusarium sp. DS 682]|nr:hypothetical protein IL306_003483 [Fusarium sp. DS 682]
MDASLGAVSGQRPPLDRDRKLFPLNTKLNGLLGSTSPKQGYIEVFLQEIWPKVESDYRAMAEEIAAVCKKELDSRCIPAFVEHRVKSHKSISKSLECRELHRTKEGKGPYNNFSSIIDDLHDLIAVSTFVTESFQQKKDPNIFPANREVSRPLHIYNDVIFEIQVTSLPASLYNKIAHPLLYKDQVGPLSRGDEIVIDLAKGLALCYSHCLYYKAKLEDEQINLMRQASSGSYSDASINNLVGILPRIPGLDYPNLQPKLVLRETFQLALEGLPAHAEN